ncbi:Sir2 family NAD-dependent protein deacetylase [Ancylobacter sp. A5.8]|uniref:SIR2 family NAD-dependent protein deacylase n=1 Tax=Ancylobacter gelatini TaxID=2919920 RepID=UPI001F4F0C33|nr:Sir2 family NAD-dependent protein deacetylase [Ancylobacter gelatini]MCJ8141558.1 Sir2 family NAD-dependent protein deacetylase [Ancylobacter gelatini]
MIQNDDIKAAAVELADIVGGMRNGVAFTGAGLSTESGIPDFRSPGGLWTRNRPIDFDAFLRSHEMRSEAWRRRFEMEAAFGGARPTRGHRALARLLQEGRLAGIVTQNIDGLHQASGVPDDRLVELHGNSTYATCLGCDTRFELDWVRERFQAAGGTAPDCPHCDGPIKTATISFGQPMPGLAMARARELTRACDVFLAIGSSLVVYPAAGFPVAAKRGGATLVIINREATELDDIADLVIHAEIGDVFDALAEQLGPLP